jgi:hypothetical protein
LKGDENTQHTFRSHGEVNREGPMS